MGKFKDKAYYFLAEKNSLIHNEYRKYANSHSEKDRFSKIKRVIFLIRLNIYYRLMRKTTPLIKYDIAGKTQNESFESFENELMKYDIISFDIFDTLIRRPFESPTDIFPIVGEKLGIKNFKKIRIDAERTARKKKLSESGHGEVNIYDIYDIISERTGIDPQKGAETELLTEKEYCFADAYMSRVFGLLRENKKDIIIVSDMYIPHDKMEELLFSCGYGGYKKLYVSCDNSCGKNTGELFKKIADEYSGKSIVHVGDNYASDVEMAVRSGIAAKHYVNFAAADLPSKQ